MEDEHSTTDRTSEFALAVLRDEVVDLEQAALQLAMAVLDDPQLALVAAPLLRANGEQLIEITREMLLAMQETFATGSTAALVDWLRRSEAEMISLLGGDRAATVLITKMTTEFGPIVDQLDVAFAEAEANQIEVPDFLDILAEPADENLVVEEGAPIGGFINQLVTELNTALPAHWPPEHVLQLVEMVVDARLPIITGVPTSVVLDCLGAWQAGDDPWRAFLDHHDQILHTLRSDALDRDAGIDDRSSALLDAVDLAIDGKWRGAVCTAMPVIDSFIYKRRFGTYRDAYSASVRSSHEVPVGSLRSTLVVHCVAPIYADFNVVTDDPPEHLNRHAVVHTVSSKQFTKANALKAVSLAADTFELRTDQRRPRC